MKEEIMDLVEMQLNELQKDIKKETAVDIYSYLQDEFANLETWMHNNLYPKLTSDEGDDVANRTQEILNNLKRYLIIQRVVEEDDL